MKLNQLGINLIKKCEGCSLKAYPDPATGKDPWTIGYGSTGEGISAGTMWTQEQADNRLKIDLEQFSSRINRLITKPCNDNQFSSLVCFAYNVGVGNLKSSTLLKFVNEGKYNEAANEFLKWNKAAGKVMAGLTHRREAERSLFLTVS